MQLCEYLPFWNKLTVSQQDYLIAKVVRRQVPKGTLLHSSQSDCQGLLLVTCGQLRAYTMSEEGKELTLYRLFDRDMCLFSASCIMHSIQFDAMVSAQQDTVLLHIPADFYKSLMETSAAVANYTNELMASRFSDVMWLMDQILSKKLDSRLAALLLEESWLAKQTTLRLTHEQLAGHLGSAREVVTRMLRYFQSEGLVSLSRGSIRLLDSKGLEVLASSSFR